MHRDVVAIARVLCEHKNPSASSFDVEDDRFANELNAPRDALNDCEVFDSRVFDVVDLVGPRLRPLNRLDGRKCPLAEPIT